MSRTNTNNINVYFPEPLQSEVKKYSKARMRDNGKEWGLSYFLQIAAKEYLIMHPLNADNNAENK